MKEGQIKTNTIITRKPWAVAASLIVHGTAVMFIWTVAPLAPTPEAPMPLRPKAIRLYETIVTRIPPAVQAVPAQKTKSRKPTSAKGGAGTEKTSLHISVPQTYGDLFPQQFGETSSAGSADQYAKVDPELSAQTQIVVSHIDIPLKLRTKNEHATAVARLVRINDNPPWMFSYVDGDPHLRAVLYETLKSEKTRLQVPALFALLDSGELYFTLRQETLTSPPPECRKGDEQKISWAKGKITVTRTMFVPNSLCPGGGMMLPDKHWEIAKRRDAQKLQELTSSAAFFGPIRNKIPRG